jgi:hypothetical protein
MADVIVSASSLSATNSVLTPVIETQTIVFPNNFINQVLTQRSYLSKCNGYFNYNNERTLIDVCMTEAYNNHGVELTYYVTSYNLNHDKIWGEDLDRYISRKFYFQGMYQLPREDKMFTKFGIEGVDQFSIFVSKMHFDSVSTYSFDTVRGNLTSGTYNSYIPKIGDLIRSNFNNYFYEILEVKEEVGLYLLSKQHVWEFVVKPFQDTHIALSATTSATMTDIKDLTNKSSDVFDKKNDINTKKIDYLYTPPSTETGYNNPYSGW